MMVIALLVLSVLGPWVVMTATGMLTIMALPRGPGWRMAAVGFAALTVGLALALVDPGDAMDGPMRITPEFELAGIGTGRFDWLRSGGDGPAAWLSALAGLALLGALWRGWRVQPIRVAAALGLVGLAVHGIGALGIEGFYG